MSDEDEQLFGEQDSDNKLSDNEQDIFGDDGLEEDGLAGNEQGDELGDELGDEEEEGQNDEDQYETREIESRILETTIPRYPPSETPGDDTYFARVPAFLTLEPHPFDSEKFLQEIEGQSEDKDSDRLKLEDENTMRWRYARDDKGNMTKQSNARFIRWSDGALSLQLGAEIFDVTVQDPYEPTFLCLSHPSNELLQTSALLNKNMTIVPTSTASHTHKRLTQALADRQKGATVGSFATIDDPEKRQREVEKQQQLNLKAKKKLESKQRAAQERDYDMGNRGHSGTRYGNYDNDSDDDRGGSFRHSREGYEEDDFVVDDEEEGGEGDEGGEGEDGEGEEEGEEGEGEGEGEDDILDVIDEEDEDVRAERLHKVKQRGADMYRERQEEKQANDTRDKDEAEKRKRRRIIDDEEDE